VSEASADNYAAINAGIALARLVGRALKLSGVANGSFKVCVENRSAGSLSEAVILNFAVLKATNT
jgi:hypothetical protein